MATLDLVDASVVEIHDITVITLHKAGIEIGSVNPYAYVVLVAFRRIKYQDPAIEPPKSGFGAQVTLTPAEMRHVQRALGVKDPMDCRGKSFAVNADWRTYDSGSALRRYVQEIVTHAHILYVRKHLNRYRVVVSYKPAARLNSLQLFFYLTCSILSLPTRVAGLTLTEDEFKKLSLYLWKDGAAPKDLAGVSFVVDPAWHADDSPEYAVNKLIGKE